MTPSLFDMTLKIKRRSQFIVVETNKQAAAFGDRMRDLSVRRNICGGVLFQAPGLLCLCGRMSPITIWTMM